MLPPSERLEQANTNRTNRSHVRCHPYPIPQPDHTTWPHHPGLHPLIFFRTVVWILLHPTWTDQWKCCETGPTIFLPYPRRQNNLTICRCHYKGSTKSSQLFIEPECCSGQGLNLRPPTQPTSTLPTELTRWQFIFPPYQSYFCHFFFQISLKMEIIWKVHSKYKTTKQCLYLPHRSFLQLSYTHPIHL